SRLACRLVAESMWANRWASRSWATSCHCSTMLRALRLKPRFTKEQSMAEVSLKNISKRFKSIAAVSNLSLDIADGEFVVLLGPTGAGKTTTLRLVAGLEKADEGEISIGGQDMA